MHHIQKQVRYELETPGMGVLKHYLKRVIATIDHHADIECSFVPNLVIKEVMVIAPDLTNFCIVEENRTVAYNVTYGINPCVDDLINWFDILSDTHGGLVQVNT
jgi:hypothetical protein